MSHDPNEKAGEASRTGHPANWDRNEVRSDPPDDPDAASTGEEAPVPNWNEGQMGEQHADGTRAQGPTDEEIASSAGGLSGGGTNPGGGERWADRDDESTED
jgi:hypothetical protein